MIGLPLSIASVLVSLIPVVLFLVGLILLDSFKLVRFKSIRYALLAGILAALAAFGVNTWFLGQVDVSPSTFSRYFAPITEESLKAVWIIWLIKSDKIGFTVDAAIYGFAVGAGFAVLENIYFLQSVDAGLQTWILRGFGTAIMHGVATSLLAILFILIHRFKENGVNGFLKNGLIILPFLAAIGFHSLYNHFPFSPLVSVLLLVILAPIVMRLVFAQGENITRNWIGAGFDTDQELLALLKGKDFSHSRMGRYLTSLQSHFEGKVIADMFCLIQLRVELSIRAKGVIMMREAGFEPKPNAAIRAKFIEVKFLEESIGRTGLLAIDPIHKWSGEDLWQMNMLADA